MSIRPQVIVTDYPPSLAQLDYPIPGLSGPSNLSSSTNHPIYPSPVRREPPRPPRPRPGGSAVFKDDPQSVRSAWTRRLSHDSSRRDSTSVDGRPKIRTAGGTSILSGREGSASGSKAVSINSPNPADLQIFAQHCREFYFSANPAKHHSVFITNTLASLPPAHKPTYTRLQASLRSLSHLHHLRLRISSYQALISSLTPSGSLTPPARSDLNGRGQVERKERLKIFLETWCAPGGVEPFFRGLWAVLRTQSRRRGGAGSKRVVWEIEDAVFLQSGGTEFMAEAITMMKGVLGFVDQPLNQPLQLRRPAVDSEIRSRSFSDPFIDLRSPQMPNLSLEQHSPEAVPLLRTRSDVSDAPDIRSTGEILTDEQIASEEAELNLPRLRIWTFPEHLTDEEAEMLMNLFPAFVRIIRGKVQDPCCRDDPPEGKDLEHGGLWESITVEGKVILTPVADAENVLKYGTGRMWVGTDFRHPGWAGGRWFRFKRWWKSLFGMG